MQVVALEWTVQCTISNPDHSHLAQCSVSLAQVRSIFVPLPITSAGRMQSVCGTGWMACRQSYSQSTSINMGSVFLKPVHPVSLGHGWVCSPPPSPDCKKARSQVLPPP